jgi:hypothetical protein
VALEPSRSGGGGRGRALRSGRKATSPGALGSRTRRSFPTPVTTRRGDAASPSRWASTAREAWLPPPPNAATFPRRWSSCCSPWPRITPPLHPVVLVQATFALFICGRLSQTGHPLRNGLGTVTDEPDWVTRARDRAARARAHELAGLRDVARAGRQAALGRQRFDALKPLLSSSGQDSRGLVRRRARSGGRPASPWPRTRRGPRRPARAGQGPPSPRWRRPRPGRR